MRALALAALDAAASEGATYADCRVLRMLRQDIQCEDARVASIKDRESLGLGVRVIAGGAWGFAATRTLSAAEAKRAAKLAVAVARASGRAPGARPVALVPEPPRKEAFRTPFEIDPFSVGVSDKTALLLRINERLRGNPGIKKAEAAMHFKKDEKVFLSTEGADLSILTVTSAAWYQATAVGPHDARTRAYQPPPRNAGYENIDAADLLAHCDRVAEQAVAHLTAKECPVGVKDLILDPHNLALTIHESVGHATELDRALGMEESLAGRSFATPDKLKRLQYGAEIVNLVADNTLPQGLATTGFDDEGVAAQRWAIVENGLFSGYGTSREVASAIGETRARGTCRADAWSSIPIVRIPNLSLMPGKTACTLEDLIADTEDGIYIEGRGSFSIDQMRCNFQFGGDACWEVKHGKVVGMLKNVTYQAITTDFWNACVGIADQRFWVPNGVLNCGKGDPMQVAQMTHGASPAKFRGIQIGGARASLGGSKT